VELVEEQRPPRLTQRLAIVRQDATASSGDGLRGDEFAFSAAVGRLDLPSPVAAARVVLQSLHHRCGAKPGRPDSAKNRPSVLKRSSGRVSSR
jgi:hypothetical protein